jgi:threonine dehydratase
MTASLRAGKIVTLPTVGLFADGAAVKTVGKETFNVCHQLVDEMITVQTGHYNLNSTELNRKS